MCYLEEEWLLSLREPMLMVLRLYLRCFFLFILRINDNKTSLGWWRDKIRSKSLVALEEGFDLLHEALLNLPVDLPPPQLLYFYYLGLYLPLLQEYLLKAVLHELKLVDHQLRLVGLGQDAFDVPAVGLGLLYFALQALEHRPQLGQDGGVVLLVGDHLGGFDGFRQDVGGFAE